MSTETLRKRLQALGHNLTPDQILEVRDALLPGFDRNAATAIKSRIAMDETRVHIAPDGTRMTLEDLLVNDSDVLVDKMLHAGYGAAAEQAIVTDYGNRVGMQFSKIDDIIEHLNVRFSRNQYANGIASSGGAEAINADIQNLRTASDIIAGIPIHESDTRGMKFIETIRNMNFIATMSNLATGLTNFMEHGGALARTGVTAMFKSYPEIFSTFNEITLNKSIDSQMARELVAMGLGTSRMNRRKIGLLSSNNRIGAANEISGAGARFAADFSMQSYGQDMLEISTTLALHQRMIGDALNGGINMNEFKTRSMGLSDNDVAIIEAQLRRHASMNPDGTYSANFDRWDASAMPQASKMQGAIRLVSTRVIQRGDVTQLPIWFQHPIGRLMLQLKTYAYQATINKLAYNIAGIANRDIESANELIFSSVFAALGYVGATHIRAFGKTEQEKTDYLDKNLTTDRILKASFSRAAYSGIVPTAVDMTLQGLGENEMFSYAKNSARTNNIFTGNPTYTWASGAGKALSSGVLHWLNPNQDLTKQDMRNIADGMWLPKGVGIKNYFERMISDLPDKTVNVFPNEDTRNPYD
jgi:hypothetical protein